MLSGYITRTCGLTRQTSDLSEEISVLSVYIGDEPIPKRIEPNFHPYHQGSLEGYVQGLLPLVKGHPFWESILMKAEEENCQVLQLNRGSLRGPLRALPKKIKRGLIDMLFSDSNITQEVNYLEVKIFNCSLNNDSYWCNYEILGELDKFYKKRESLFKELQKEITAKNLEGVLFIV